MSNIDWMDGSFAIQADSSELEKPPIAGLVVTLVISLLALVLVLLKPNLGYVVSVIASSVGGFTAVSDQKKQGDANYVSYSWFVPSLRAARFFALATAIANIVVMAVDIASGGSLL